MQHEHIRLLPAACDDDGGSSVPVAGFYPRQADIDHCSSSQKWQNVVLLSGPPSRRQARGVNWPVPRRPVLAERPQQRLARKARRGTPASPQKLE